MKFSNETDAEIVAETPRARPPLRRRAGRLEPVVEYKPRLEQPPTVTDMPLAQRLLGQVTRREITSEQAARSLLQALHDRVAQDPGGAVTAFFKLLRSAGQRPVPRPAPRTQIKQR